MAEEKNPRAILQKDGGKSWILKNIFIFFCVLRLWDRKQN